MSGSASSSARSGRSAREAAASRLPNNVSRFLTLSREHNPPERRGNITTHTGNSHAINPKYVSESTPDPRIWNGTPANVKQFIRLSSGTDPRSTNVGQPSITGRSLADSNTAVSTSIWKPSPLGDYRKEIRLLYVAPNPDLEAPIVSLTSIYNLASIRNYNALSYVCGDPARKKPIRVDGHLIDVYSNLEIALRHVRFKLGQRVGFLIWVDAVCIDPTNMIEKQVQISLMGTIYTQCQQVIIWLGETSANSDKHLAFLDRPYRGSHKLPDKPLEDAAFAVLESNWWERVWCHQEIILAPSGFFLCGKATARIDYVLHNLTELCRAISLWHGRPPHDVRGRLTEEVYNHRLTRLRTAIAIRLSMIDAQQKAAGRCGLPSATEPQTATDLLCLMDFFRNPRTTIPSGNIFALLELARNDPVAARNT